MSATVQLAAQPQAAATPARSAPSEVWHFGDPSDPRWGLALASVLPAFASLLIYMSDPVLLANATGSVIYWDVILILSSAVILGLATRTVGRRSRRDRPAEADAEDASLQPARGECGSAAI